MYLWVYEERALPGTNIISIPYIPSSILECLANGCLFFSLFLMIYLTDSSDFQHIYVNFDAGSDFLVSRMYDASVFLLPVLLKTFQMVISPKLFDLFGSFLKSWCIFGFTRSVPCQALIHPLHSIVYIRVPG